MSYWSSVTLRNNTIALNRCTTNYGCGGGINAEYGSSVPNVDGKNNIVYFNHAIRDPEWFGTVNLTYSCVRLGMPGIGNITDDPQFLDPINLNFHLLENSPCIDTGDPNSPLDPDSTRADMGALYYDQSSRIHTHSAQESPSEFALLPNYPNPFNPETRLTFAIPNTCRVNLTIYDIIGRRVGVVVDSKVSAGVHQYVWDASGLPSGIYFARLAANGDYRYQKLLFIK